MGKTYSHTLHSHTKRNVTFEPTKKCSCEVHLKNHVQKDMRRLRAIEDMMDILWMTEEYSFKLLVRPTTNLDLSGHLGKIRYHLSDILIVR